jgi:uncharacterized protein YqkB
MASELSKLIEDQLQKVDEENGLSPTEKQRLLSSSLRIKVPSNCQIVFGVRICCCCQRSCSGCSTFRVVAEEAGGWEACEFTPQDPIYPD